MMSPLLILLIIFLPVLSFLAAWQIQKFRIPLKNKPSEDIVKESAVTAALLKEKTDQCEIIRGENEKLRKALSEKESELATLKERVEADRSEFENLANKVIEERGAKFSEESKKTIDQLLLPLNERLKNFNETVQKNFIEETRERSALRNELARLHELNHKMATEAINLTNALKGESKTIGDWGEHILETILESSGLEKGVHYCSQKSYTGEDGTLQRLDIQINMPGNRTMIIDSKATLTYYQKYHSAESVNDRKAFIKKHIDSIKAHADSLSIKKYETIPALNSPDFVFMFIPVEPAFLIAMQQEPALFNDALRKRVVITGPSSLMASLKIVATMWRYENQNKNVREIAKQAGLLYDKFVSFVESLDDVGNKLKMAINAHELANKRLKSGSGNLIVSAEKIVKLGAKPAKSLDRKLISSCELEQEASDD